MLSFIKNIFKQKVEEVNESEQKLIKDLIESLKTNPDYYSATNFGYSSSLQNYVVNRRSTVLIRSDGSIIKPFKIEMNNKQKEEIKSLIDVVFKRDREYLINNSLV